MSQTTDELTRQMIAAGMTNVRVWEAPVRRPAKGLLRRRKTTVAPLPSFPITQPQKGSR